MHTTFPSVLIWVYPVVKFSCSKLAELLLSGNGVIGLVDFALVGLAALKDFFQPC